MCAGADEHSVMLIHVVQNLVKLIHRPYSVKLMLEFRLMKSRVNYGVFPLLLNVHLSLVVVLDELLSSVAVPFSPSSSSAPPPNEVAQFGSIFRCWWL